MGKWTLERWMMIGAFVFTLGTNWGRVWSQQTEIEKLKTFNETTLRQEYVAKGVYVAERQNLTDAIDRLTKTLDRQAESLDKLYTLEQRTGEPSRVQRIFDK